MTNTHSMTWELRLLEKRLNLLLQKQSSLDKSVTPEILEEIDSINKEISLLEQIAKDRDNILTETRLSPTLETLLQNQHIRPNKDELRYYVYISTLKIKTLYTQLANTTKKVNISQQILNIEELLIRKSLVGTIHSPNAYIRDTLPMFWEDLLKDIVFFIHKDQKNLVVLFGHSPAVMNNKRRYLNLQTKYAFFRAMEHYINEKPHLKTSLGKDWRSMEISSLLRRFTDIGLEDAHEYPNENILFFARTLYIENDNDQSVILGTPVYCALADSIGGLKLPETTANSITPYTTVEDDELKILLHKILPIGTDDIIDLLIDMVNTIASGKQLILFDEDKSKLQRASTLLAGNTINTSHSLISFGDSSQSGDITIGDIAGGHIIKVNISIQL